jgi:cytochrome c-type biogenesis protein
MSEVSFAIAFIGGGLATLNPCGFPMLPAFLSFYAGADETRLPPAQSRVAQGLLAGLLVTAGFLGVFAVIGLLLSLPGSRPPAVRRWRRRPRARR